MDENENPTDHQPSTINHSPKKRGPKTPEGKRKSSMNALVWGRYAKTEEALRVLEERKRAEMLKQGPLLEDIQREMEEFFQPNNALDRRLVRHVAVCLWRLARTEHMERRAVERNSVRPFTRTEMDEIVKYERRVELQLLRSLAALGYTQVPKRFLRGNDLFPRSD